MATRSVADRQRRSLRLRRLQEAFHLVFSSTTIIDTRRLCHCVLITPLLKLLLLTSLSLDNPSPTLANSPSLTPPQILNSCNNERLPSQFPTCSFGTPSEKSKYVVGLVGEYHSNLSHYQGWWSWSQKLNSALTDRAVKSICEMWDPQDIPSHSRL